MSEKPPIFGRGIPGLCWLALFVNTRLPSSRHQLTAPLCDTMDRGDLALVGMYYTDIYLGLRPLFGHLAWVRYPSSRVLTRGVIRT